MANGFDVCAASDVVVAVFMDRGAVPPQAAPFAAPYLERPSSVARYEAARKQAMLGHTIRVQLHKADPSAAHDPQKALRIEVLSLLTADVLTKLRKAGIDAERRHAIEIFEMAKAALERVTVRRGFSWIWQLADRVVAEELAKHKARLRVTRPVRIAVAQSEDIEHLAEAEFEAIEADASLQLKLRA